VKTPRKRSETALAEARGQEPLPIQPVPNPILCTPYEEPGWHWLYDTQTGAASKTQGRRDASYWFRSQRTSAGQLSLLAQEESDPLPLVNALRDDVRRWRKSEWDGATPVTKQLLRHWTRADRARRLFFCQREAVETVIYLTEILGAGRTPRFRPKLSVEDFERLRRGDRVSSRRRKQNWAARVARRHPERARPRTTRSVRMQDGHWKRQNGRHGHARRVDVLQSRARSRQ
jgi:type III restriction enzyme